MPKIIVDFKHNFKYNILGTPWSIRFANPTNDPMFADTDYKGYTKGTSHIICIRQFNKHGSNELDTDVMTASLKHEIVHAFLYECGLHRNTLTPNIKHWAVNEEMVDWISMNAEKIAKLYKELGLI